MKKILLALAMVGLLPVLALASNDGHWIINASSANVNAGFEENLICIGGEICGKESTVSVIYYSTTYVAKMRVLADDNVGSKTKAHLQLYADGQLIGEQDVSRHGSWLEFNVGRRVNSLMLKSVHESHAPNGDETEIAHIVTF
jgi:hypothetical protein